MGNLIHEIEDETSEVLSVVSETGPVVSSETSLEHVEPKVFMMSQGKKDD